MNARRTMPVDDDTRGETVPAKRFMGAWVCTAVRLWRTQPAGLALNQCQKARMEITNKLKPVHPVKRLVSPPLSSPSRAWFRTGVSEWHQRASETMVTSLTFAMFV